MAQAVDSNATLGNTDLSAQFEFWAGAALPIGLAISPYFNGPLLAKPLNRMDLMTLPDFYRRKYGRTVEVLASPIMVLSLAILLAGNLVAGGYLFEFFTGTTCLEDVLLVLGLYLSKANAPAAIASIVRGAIVRLGLFVLTPTTFGTKNTLLYIPNIHTE